MVEIVFRIIGSLMPSLLTSVLKRDRLKIICGWSHQPNASGIGNYLTLWIKIINPTPSPVYFERLTGIDQSGETFFPLFFGIKPGQKISPRNNILGFIPCGHITSSPPRELRIYDATENCFTLKGRAFRRVVKEITEERQRLEGLNLSVHPSHPLPD